MRSLSYHLITAPAEYPISLGEIKRYAVIEHNDDDALLIELINDATDYAQRYMHQQLVNAVYEVFYQKFDDCLELPIKPVSSVGAVTYYDTNGDEQTLDTAVYETDLYSLSPSVLLADGQQWPSISSRVNPVKVTFTAGYGTAEDVPGGIKRAIAMLVRHFDENREGVAFTQVREMPHSVTSLLNRYRNHQPV